MHLNIPFLGLSIFDIFTLVSMILFGKDGGFWYGDAILSSLEQSAEAEQPVSYSGSLTGSGALVYSTLTPVSSNYP